jgi:hypothetical protein
VNLPELTELLKAIAPAVAGLVSLAHPAAAVIRRRRREAKLRELIRQEVTAALMPVEARVRALERRTPPALPQRRGA